MASILVIEDNPANLKLASLLLRNVGHRVLSATDAEAALLKQAPLTASIPVIALTALAMKADQEKAATPISASHCATRNFMRRSMPCWANARCPRPLPKNPLVSRP